MKKFLISIILIIILIIISIIVYSPHHKEVENQNINNDGLKEETKTVEDIKKEIGATASEDIYEIQKEYDGREILSIKPDIQYQTVLTGILKNEKPSLQDIQQLDISNFHKGVWISEVSRDKFLQILKKCKIENFEIDSDGYLYKKQDSSNELSLKLENLINSNELIIIDITGTCYIRDEMTGDIVEYPFKDMDLYQICEIFTIEKSTIFVITTNDVEENDILESILEQ